MLYFKTEDTVNPAEVKCTLVSLDLSTKGCSEYFGLSTEKVCFNWHSD